jgi:hypothetical protein
MMLLKACDAGLGCALLGLIGMYRERCPGVAKWWEKTTHYIEFALRITTIYTMEVLKVESDEATIRQLVLCYGKVTVGPFDKSLGTQLVAS